MRWHCSHGHNNEHPERNGWWLNELDLLDISTKRINELNDLKEIRNLTENQDYKTEWFYTICYEMNAKVNFYCFLFENSEIIVIMGYNRVILFEDIRLNISETEATIRGCGKGMCL